MDEVDFPRFLETLTILGEAFDTKLSPQRQNIYFEALSEYPWAGVEGAIKRAIKQCKFFPKVADLVELIEGSPADHAAQADDAWRQLWKALSHGTYRSLFCEDRVLAETVRQLFGDWPAVGMLPRADNDDGPMYRVRQKEFIAAYVRLLNRGGSYEPYLIGRTESENHQKSLAAFGQGGTVTYLPRSGEPVAVELRALMPDHPLVALMDARERLALPASEEPDDDDR